MPWFSRVWVIQEIGLAANATLLYGRASISWSEIVQFIVLVDKQIDVNTAAPLDLSIGPVLEVFYAVWLSYDNPRSWRKQLRHIARPSPEFTSSHFLNVLLTGSSMEAADPRDRVYAFLGHATAKAKGANKTLVEADYEISKEQLYTDLTIRLLTESKSLTALSAARHSERTVSDGFPYMPSWVERWDVTMDIIPLGVPVGTLQLFYDADCHQDTGGLSEFNVSELKESETGF